MKKFILLAVLTAILGMCMILNSAPVSRQEAQKIATAWYKHICPASVPDCTVEQVYTANYDGVVTFYTFVFKNGGFVIVAADDASIPILGYSADNEFPQEITCPAVKAWLDDYSMQIKEIVKAGLSNKETINQWEAIRNGIFIDPRLDVGPLLTTTWWQGCYYNELCPLDPASPEEFCGHVPTGCVATAMAQIMKYHNHPPQGVGQYTYFHPVYGTQSADFGNTTYLWAVMPNELTSSNIPVATLLYHAGVSVTMNYNVTGSIPAGDILRAFVDYFNYDPGLKWNFMYEYTELETWKDMLRADLDNNLPVLYSGSNPIEGHAFVCDGYSMSDQKFHFNWGWNGNYDGWYVIGTLNPGPYTYNLDNYALFHIKPGNPGFITRITQPFNNFLHKAGDLINIETSTVRGTPDKMYITIDGITVASGNSATLSYTWNTLTKDLGSHDVRAWSVAGSDTVYYPINLNVSDWKSQASGFTTPLRNIRYLSAVDSNVVWAIARDGLDGMFAACQDFTRTTDGGATWIPGTIPGCEGLSFAMICGISTDKAYAAMYRWSGSNPMGIYVTTDGGITWTRQATASFTSPTSFPDCIHFFNENEGWCMGDPANGEFEIFTTINGGAQWNKVTGDSIPDPLSYEGGIPGYSSVHDTLWFGTNKGRIYKSMNKGRSWKVVQVSGMNEEYIIPVFQNGSHGLVHNFFIRGDTGWICETFDGGDNWALINAAGPMQFTSLNYIPGTENTWVSTGGYQETGASVSYDGGHTWELFPGTEGARLFEMTWVNPQCGWAGGYNLSATESGVFKFADDLQSHTGIVGPVAKSMGISVFPNPFSDQTIFVFNIPKIHMVSLKIYDLTGREIETLVSGRLERGEHTYILNAANFQSGIYIYRLTAGDEVAAGKVVVRKE